MNATDGSLTLPVIAGLAVGIGLIVLFSFSLKPSFSKSDDQVSHMVAQLPEVQAFVHRFESDGPPERLWHEGSSRYVEFAEKRTWNPSEDPTCKCDDITKELRLAVKVDSFGRTSMQLECLGPISGGEATTVESIRTTMCIENP